MSNAELRKRDSESVVESEIRYLFSKNGRMKSVQNMIYLTHAIE
jgi:hypothetical protein